MFKTFRKWERLSGAEHGTSRVLAVIGFAVLVCDWALVLSFIAPRTGTLAFLRLHYSATFGVDWIDRWYYLLLYPVLGLAIFVVNGYFAGVLSRRHRLLGIVMLSATVIIEILFAAGALIAILLNR